MAPSGERFGNLGRGAGAVERVAFAAGPWDRDSKFAARDRGCRNGLGCRRRQVIVALELQADCAVLAGVGAVVVVLVKCKCQLRPREREEYNPFEG